MFTKAELLEQYKSLSLKPLHLLQVNRFDKSTHPSIDQESGYIIYRSSIDNFDGAMQFYCNAIVEWDAKGQNFQTWQNCWQGWVTREIEAALCLPLSKAEFYKKLNTAFHDVHDSLQLPDSSEFVAALQMENEWNDVGISVQFKHEYIYVWWHTTG